MAVHESPEEQNMRLALALLEDKESALEEILRLYGPGVMETLHATFVKRLGALRHEDIEDVVSLALWRLWKARASYDDKKQSLRVWFYCIAENAAKDVLKYGWYKARRLERHPGQDWLEEKSHTSPDPSPQSGSEKRKASKEATDLEQVVNKLSHEQRRIVMADAASRDGRASDDFLADELEIPAAHVRVYRGRADATIRREMRKLGHDIPEPRKDKP